MHIDNERNRDEHIVFFKFIIDKAEPRHFSLKYLYQAMKVHGSIIVCYQFRLFERFFVYWMLENFLIQ